MTRPDPAKNAFRFPLEGVVQMTELGWIVSVWDGGRCIACWDQDDKLVESDVPALRDRVRAFLLEESGA